MRVHLQRDIEKLKRRLLVLSSEVEEDVRLAVRALAEHDETLAREVVAREIQTNEMEVDIEEDCLKILALHQPVAGDLRYIIAALKIDRDLERIGDLAAHIAERSLTLADLPPLDIPFRLDEMGAKVQAMLKKALDAFTTLDSAAAHEVCRMDGEINAIKRHTFRQVRDVVMEAPVLFNALMQVMHISRHLERIADHATNIAEDIIYLADGRIVRHTPEVASPPAPDQ
jgi:phosphate transport system protein